MTTARKTALIAVLAVAAGCGGAKPDSNEPLEAARGGQTHDISHKGMSHDGGHMGSGEADEMAAMPTALRKFHEVLAPHWHAKQGPERLAGTCAAIAEFHADADAIVAAPAPERHAAAAWSSGGTQLAEAVNALDTTCKAHDAAGFETAFAQVHARFHGLLEAGGEPKPDDHGDRDRDDHDHP